jgi:hypothetical protein
VSLTELDQGVTADTPAATTTPDATADTSTANQTPEPSFTDVVLKALERKEESPASKVEPGQDAAQAAGKTPDTTSKPDAEASDDPDDPHKLSPDEEQALKPKTKQRIDALLGQRTELRENLTAKDREIESLKPEAESYRKVAAYMRENGLTAQDAGEAFRWAALMKSDPQAAFEALRPVMLDLAQKVGAVLPTDLAEDVRLGRITQQRAQELARSRAQSTMAQSQVEANRQAEAQRAQAEREAREQEQQVQHVRSMAKIGDELAAARAQNDPDWKSKEPLVIDRLKLDITQNGVPKDKADLEKRFNEVVKGVTSYLTGLGVSKPKPTAAMIPVAGASSPGSDTRPPPKDAAEAVLRALGE